MKHSLGELTEIFHENGQVGGRIRCSSNLNPAPGQYFLIHGPASNDLLPVLSPLGAAVFISRTSPGEFLVAPPIPQTWHPGMQLFIRGPLGHGFSLPKSSLRVALVGLSSTNARLQPLLHLVLSLDASVVLVSQSRSPDLPVEIEIQPISAIKDVVHWANYLAIDLERDSLSGLKEMLGFGKQVRIPIEAQMLVDTAMPCGGMAECGVCALKIGGRWKLACKEGPVFKLV
ncbi:MAG: hypothetical protein QGD96_07360 [Anaerolineae bacterium]|nr:hypothetical protein [Anaerolineae bacterium]